MNPYECYVDYLALKRHFNSEGYDYFKYNGKVPAKIDSFNKRKDKYFFEKLAKHRDAHRFLLANFAVNPNLWIRDVAFSENAQVVYDDWNKRLQSLSYHLQNDLSQLDDEFNRNFIVEGGQHPKLVKLYYGSKISLETVIVLVDVSECLPYWKRQLNEEVMWKDLEFRIRKYSPFIKYDKDRIRKIILDKF